MNEEGISSLPVLDNQKNVVGNISHVDVKVRKYIFSKLCKPMIDLGSLAADKVELSSFTKLVMYSFHNHYPSGARNE